MVSFGVRLKFNAQKVVTPPLTNSSSWIGAIGSRFHFCVQQESDWPIK